MGKKKKLKVMLKTHKGHWTFKFSKHPFKFSIHHGIIRTKKGEKIRLHVSKNKKYPASKGWKVFYRHNKTFYMLITSSGMKLLKFNKNGKKIVGKVTKKPNIKKNKKKLKKKTQKKKLKAILKNHKGHRPFN